MESSQPAELKKTKEPKPSARPHPPKATAAASKAPSTQKVEKPADAEPAGVDMSCVVLLGGEGGGMGEPNREVFVPTCLPQETCM